MFRSISRSRRRAIGLALAASLVVAATATTAVARTEKTQQPQATKVTLQLLWLPQAQFAGYYAALANGYYRAEGLDVKIRPGGPDLSPAQLVASGDAQFGVLTLGQTLQARDSGIGLQNIAQIFARSAYRLVYFKDSGITSIRSLRGKRVGVWPGTLQLYAALDKFGINKDQDLTLVQQPFTMAPFIERKLDAASATTYNEFAQVLKAGIPRSSVDLISFDAVGTGQLEDGLIASTSYLSSAENRATATRFVRASLRGWLYCRDAPSACVKLVQKQAPNLDTRLQTWMMNEVNKLIWPATKSSNGIGAMPTRGTLNFNQTAQMLLKYDVLKKAASRSAYRTDIWRAATANMSRDAKFGLRFKPMTLTDKYLRGS